MATQLPFAVATYIHAVDIADMDAAGFTIKDGLIDHLEIAP